MTYGLILNGLWLPDYRDTRPSRFPIPRPDRFDFTQPKPTPHPTFVEAARRAYQIPVGNDDRFEVWEKMLAEYIEGDKTPSAPLLRTVRSNPNFLLPRRHLDARTHFQMSNWFTINVGVREFIRETLHTTEGGRGSAGLASRILALDDHLLMVSRSLVDLRNTTIDEGMEAAALLQRAQQSLSVDASQDELIGPIMAELRYDVASAALGGGVGVAAY